MSEDLSLVPTPPGTVYNITLVVSSPNCSNTPVNLSVFQSINPTFIPYPSIFPVSSFSVLSCVWCWSLADKAWRCNQKERQTQSKMQLKYILRSWLLWTQTISGKQKRKARHIDMMKSHKGQTHWQVWKITQLLSWLGASSKPHLAVKCSFKTLLETHCQCWS